MFGSRRIGVFKFPTNDSEAQTFYELTDNIGNVRAVINSLQVDGDIKLESFADYYSFGLPMPGQHANTQEYELDYQGQRKDAETGFNAFELRMFDARIGRWMAPDPYEQHWSPYLAMSNNPIQYIDPDGGSDKTSNEEDFKRLTRETREAALAKFHGDVNSEIFADISPRDREDIITMNPHMRDQLQNYYGSTAAAQDINRLFTLASLGGYKDKDGNMLHALNGKLGYYVSVEGKFKNVPPTLKTIEGSTAMTYEPAEIIEKFIPISGGGVSGGGEGWYDNAGVYFTGAFLTAEDIYNNYYHNHSTYTTTKGVVKNIYKANGEVRSARAAQFARTSMTLKILGTSGTVLMTAQAGTKIYNGSATAWDYGDFTVGSVGTVAGAAELIGGASYAVPGLGEAVAAYAWFRLWYDLGAKYGPSKWYGNDDTRWFK